MDGREVLEIRVVQVRERVNRVKKIAMERNGETGVMERMRVRLRSEALYCHCTKLQLIAVAARNVV